MASQVAAAFDFDGTLARVDSFPRFLLFVSGPLDLARRALPALPTLLGYGFGAVSNEDAKQRLLACVLGGRPLDELQARGRDFARERLAGLLDARVMERFHWHRREGHRCLLVSASLDVYLQPWAEAMGFHGIACSALATDAHGRVTGRLRGANCYGEEKRRRLLELLSDRASTELYAYGDSRGDREMLAEADHPFLRMRPCPRARQRTGG